jgi:hypothetical protein
MKTYRPDEMDLMIDYPEYMEPVENWQAWLEKLRGSADSQHPAVQRAIQEAERWIPQREALDRELEEQAKAA